MAEAINNTARQRHGMVAEASMAYVTYARKDGRIALVHTEVPSALAGRGVGSALARSVLDTRIHIRNALGYGATAAEIIAVFQLMSVEGLRSSTMAAGALSARLGSQLAST